MKIRLFCLSALSVAILSGCQLAPEQKDLALPVPDAYASVTGQTEIESLKWQEFFNDEKLQTLISQSLNHNKDLQIAMLNVERVL